MDLDERVYRLLENGKLNENSTEALRFYLDHVFWSELWAGIGLWSFFTLLVVLGIIAAVKS